MSEVSRFGSGSTHRMLRILHDRLPHSYELIADAVAGLPVAAPLAESQFDEFVGLYAGPARIARIARQTVFLVILMIELGTPVAIAWLLVHEDLSHDAAVVLALALLSVGVLLSPYWTARKHESWSRRAAGLTVTTSASAAVVAVTWLWPDLVPPLLHPVVAGFGPAVTFAAAGMLLSVVVIRILRRMCCRITAVLMPTRPRAHLVCELVQAVDLLRIMPLAEEPDRERQRWLLIEKFDSVRHIYGTGALVAAFPLTRDARREAMQTFKATRRALERYRDTICRYQQAEDRESYLATLAAQVLTEQESTHTEIIESKPSRIWPALQLTAACVGVAALVAGALLLADLLGPTVGTIVSALIAGVISTVITPLLKNLARGADLSWLTRLVPAKDAAGSGPDPTDSDAARPEDAQ